MTLGDIEIFVGVVVKIDDPLNEGRIKVTSPGIFDINTMGIDDIFWISPLTINYQNYSQLNVGNKVWVFHNVNNYMEYWYLPFFELNPNTKSLINNDDVDILISRYLGSGASSQLYANPNEGILMKNTDKDESIRKIQLDPAGNVNVIGNTDIKVVTNNESKGTTLIGHEANGNEKTVNGETLVKAVNELMDILNTTANSLSLNPYTASIGSAMVTKITKWKATYSESNLLSTSVNICK